MALPGGIAKGIPEKLGHYRIAAKLGEGGMGEVYLAHDERLERNVAIKVLPVGVIADENARKRFRKEALALSQLNHPNIETIFDFDTEDSLDFIVTEYVIGEGLDKKLANGALPDTDVVGFGLQLAEGLAAAHAHGIVHRDLKPANLHITPDQRLKILDFGLAKLVTAGEDAATASQSEHTRFAGTLPYMAPEQINGSAIDARTDIWAAGCVLYEMATARRAFPARGLHVADEILHQRSTAPSNINPKISPALDAVILRCLDKVPHNRYQAAQELAEDLRHLKMGAETVALAMLRGTRRKARIRIVLGMIALASVITLLLALNFAGIRNRMLRPSAKRITSIAVLPLENLSGDIQQEFFADGMTESLINNLQRLTGLKRVMARGAVMRFKGLKQSPAEIARELKVDALITGAVLRSSNQVRVTAQLIDPEGEQLWTETYERPLVDILQLQAEMTNAIAAEIRVKLTANEQIKLASVRPIDPEAYDAYLMGRYHMYKMTSAGLQRAIEYFQLSLEKDPSYAPAFLGIASVWGMREHLGFVPAGEGQAKAKPFITKVLATDSTSAEAHELLAVNLAWHEWRWDAGLKEFQRAIELNPSYADAHFFYSQTLYALRHPDQARQQMDAALELDPYNPSFHRFSGIQWRDQGEFSRALLEFDRAASLDPALELLLDQSRTYGRMGRYKEAIEVLKKFFAVRRPEAVRALEVGYASGDYVKAMRHLADTMAAQSIKGADRSSIMVASFYATAGEVDRALDWLEPCVGRIGPLPYINAQDGAFEQLRTDPRFKQLLRRMDLE